MDLQKIYIVSIIHLMNADVTENQDPALLIMLLTIKIVSLICIKATSKDVIKFVKISGFHQHIVHYVGFKMMELSECTITE